jgi:phosphatidylserine decarboxylase
MFCKSVRDITVLETKKFGRVIYVEVGSTFVSSIVQNHDVGDNIKRGNKKGCFKFGGSTVILLFEKNKIKLDKNILKATKNHKEIYTEIGKVIGRKA